MSVDKARFKPGDTKHELHLEIEAVDLTVKYGSIKELLKLRVKEWQMQNGQQL